MSDNIVSFDVFRTKDGTVSKYMHDDGSETAIKMNKSIQSILNPLTKAIEVRNSDRNKYSVFISSSVGCYMNCPFCHLTIKNAKYSKITEDRIFENLKEALLDKIEFAPEIKEKYLKLSWMGMGDAINIPEVVYSVSIKFIDWVLENNYAKGLDGVDLSTVMPKVSNKWVPIFQKLNDELKKYKTNPVYSMDNISYTNGSYDGREPFRLFYSVHSAIQEKREGVVPNAMLLVDSLKVLKEYSQEGKFSLIIHHLLVEGLNDTQEEIEALAEMINNELPNNELRVLRYNFCAKSEFKESDQFLKQIRFLSEKINFLKVQVSPGDEVSAACGQFVVKDFIRIKAK